MRTPFAASLADGGIIKVTMGLHKIAAQAPYFTITGDIYDCHGEHETSGCIHDEILKQWPDLAPVVRLHLSNAVTGAPIHALENAWYWAGGTQWQTAHVANLMGHLRISEDAALALIGVVPKGKPAFADCIDSMRQRWAREAAEVIAEFDLEVFE